MIRARVGLYTGSLDYSSLINGWHGASAFTHMNQPLLPEFSDAADELTGFGPVGMVGTAGLVLAGSQTVELPTAPLLKSLFAFT